MTGWVAGAIVVGAVVTSEAAKSSAKKGRNAQQAATDSATAEQRRATAEAQGYYEPYAGVGERGVEMSGFLGDSQAQFDWLQGNPLFQMGLDNANRTTQANAASKGRLSAGDTLMQLNNNALLTASPLIDRQRNDINNLMNFGYGVSSGQANAAIGAGNNVSDLMTNQGNSNAAYQIANGNANQQLIGDLGTASMMWANQGGGGYGGGGFGGTSGAGMNNNFVANNQGAINGLFGSPYGGNG